MSLKRLKFLVILRDGEQQVQINVGAFAFSRRHGRSYSSTESIDDCGFATPRHPLGVSGDCGIDDGAEFVSCIL